MDKPKNGSAAALRISEDIVPIGDFKAHLSERIRSLRDHHRPLVITQNGKAAAVLLAPEEFDRIASQASLIAAVREGLDDLEGKRVISHDELGSRLDARFGGIAKSK